ncbi:hypothetical protein D9M68_934910 [compost metagenome]
MTVVDLEAAVSAFTHLTVGAEHAQMALEGRQRCIRHGLTGALTDHQVLIQMGQAANTLLFHQPEQQIELQRLRTMFAEAT